MAASVNVVANPARRYRRRTRRAPYRRRASSYRGRGRYRRRSYRRYTPRAPPMRRRRGLTKFQLGQVDPFDDRVFGVKIPDSNTMPSSTFVVNDEWDLATAVGQTYAAAAFQPELSNTRYAATAAAGVFTWPNQNGGTVSSRFGAAQANYQMYRVASHGIRISVPTAPTSTVGFLHVCIYSNDLAQANPLRLPTTVAQMNNSTWYKRYTLASLTQQPLTIVNKILDCTTQMYRDINLVDQPPATTGSASILHTTGWSTIVVAVEGVPAQTTALSVESIYHCEVLPLATGIISPSPAAPFNSAELEGASNIARREDATMLDTEKTSHLAQAVQAVEEGASRGLGRAVDRLATGAGRVVEYAVDYAVGAGAQYVAGKVLGIPGVTNVGRLQM